MTRVYYKVIYFQIKSNFKLKYYRIKTKDAVGCFIVFDVTRASTFEAVIRWKNDLDSKVSLPDGSRIPCVLLANKV